MSNLVFNCHLCESQFQAPALFAGRPVTCPNCNQLVNLPEASAAETASQATTSPPPPPPMNSPQSVPSPPSPPVAPPPAPGNAPLPPVPVPTGQSPEPTSLAAKQDPQGSKVLSCPFCQGKFQVGLEHLGQSVGCPLCAKSVDTRFVVSEMKLSDDPTTGKTNPQRGKSKPETFSPSAGKSTTKRSGKKPTTQRNQDRTAKTSTSVSGSATTEMFAPGYVPKPEKKSAQNPATDTKPDAKQTEKQKSGSLKAPGSRSSSSTAGPSDPAGQKRDLPARSAEPIKHESSKPGKKPVDSGTSVSSTLVTPEKVDPPPPPVEAAPPDSASPDKVSAPPPMPPTGPPITAESEVKTSGSSLGTIVPKKFEQQPDGISEHDVADAQRPEIVEAEAVVAEEQQAEAARIEAETAARNSEILAMLPQKFVDPSIAERKKNSVLIPNAHGGFTELSGATTKINYRGAQYEVSSDQSASGQVTRNIYRLVVFVFCAILLFIAFFVLMFL